MVHEGAVRDWLLQLHQWLLLRQFEPRLQHNEAEGMSPESLEQWLVSRSSLGKFIQFRQISDKHVDVAELLLNKIINRVFSWCIWSLEKNLMQILVVQHHHMKSQTQFTLNQCGCSHQLKSALAPPLSYRGVCVRVAWIDPHEFHWMSLQEKLIFFLNEIPRMTNLIIFVPVLFPSVTHMSERGKGEGWGA